MLDASVPVSKQPPLITLLMLVSLGAVGAVLYTPALPAIAQYFSVSIAAVQATITIFLGGYAVGQLIYGPLANRFGRKPALFTGLIVEVLSGLLCALSAPLHAFWLLVVGRLLMSLGGCAGLKITFTLVADIYPQSQATKVISYIMLAFAIMPGIGIAIGGFLVQHINWQSTFYFLALYGSFLLILSIFLPETLAQPDREALVLKKIVQGYLAQIKDLKFLYCALLMGCTTTFVYVFAAMAPFIVIHLLHLKPADYGLLNLLPPIGMVIGCLLSAHLAKFQKVARVMGYSLLIIGLGIAIMLIVFGVHWINATALFFPTILIYLGLPIIFANAASVASTQSANKANASAMMNFINLGTSMVGVLLIGLIPITTPWILPIVFSGLFLITVFCYFKLKSRLASS